MALAQATDRESALANLAARKEEAAKLFAEGAKEKGLDKGLDMLALLTKQTPKSAETITINVETLKSPSNTFSVVVKKDADQVAGKPTAEVADKGKTLDQTQIGGGSTAPGQKQETGKGEGR